MFFINYFHTNIAIIEISYNSFRQLAIGNWQLAIGNWQWSMANKNKSKIKDQNLPSQAGLGKEFVQ